jgi:hypothetical protein
VKILTKFHSTLDIELGATWDFKAVPLLGANQGWINLGSGVFASETYFDLGGLAMDDKTITPAAMTVQYGTFPAAQNGVAGDTYEVLDVMTSIPVDISDLTIVAQWLYQGPGMVGTTLNFEHVLYCRRQRWTLDLDTNVGFFLKADENQSGSMMPTASDRIYSYRLFVVYPRAGSTLDRVVTQDARHIMQVDVTEEPTYEYLMRLKRSYDLQQSPDVD